MLSSEGREHSSVAMLSITLGGTGQDGKLFLYAVTEKLTLAFNVANGARVSHPTSLSQISRILGHHVSERPALADMQAFCGCGERFPASNAGCTNVLSANIVI